MLDTLLSCHQEIEYRAVFTLCSPGIARDLQLARLKMFDEFNPAQVAVQIDVQTYRCIFRVSQILEAKEKNWRGEEKWDVYIRFNDRFAFYKNPARFNKTVSRNVYSRNIITPRNREI